AFSGFSDPNVILIAALFIIGDGLVRTGVATVVGTWLVKMAGSGIIRHRGKIQAIISNARAWLAMEQNGESFADFVWSFVDGQPQ
ncbi:DNA-3-methyladenine glycosylase I, partial [Salmonella enterica subsp. enterica serovar Anatum]|nr:DNA-3-methyladenine glycosylase I [Salmonella enterica subsp. enterica serovar Anatum]